MISRLRPPERSEADRGATLIDYALLFSLVVLLLIAGVDRFTESARDEIETRGETAAASGEPIGALGPSVATTPSTPPTTGTGTSADVISAEVLPLAVTTTTSSVATKWNMSVAITVLDSATGEPLEGAVVTGAFQGDSRTCITDINGTCPLTREKISHHVLTMDFTLTSVSYTNASGAPAPTIAFPAETTVTGAMP